VVRPISTTTWTPTNKRITSSLNITTVSSENHTSLAGLLLIAGVVSGDDVLDSTQYPPETIPTLSCANKAAFLNSDTVMSEAGALMRRMDSLYIYGPWRREREIRSIRSLG